MIGSPELQNLRKHLIDREHLELVKPVINVSGDTVIGVVGHDIGHVLEDLQILNRDLAVAGRLAFVGGFQLGEVFKDVPFELDPVESRNGSGF